MRCMKEVASIRLEVEIEAEGPDGGRRRLAGRSGGKKRREGRCCSIDDGCAIQHRVTLYESIGSRSDQASVDLASR